MVSLSNQCKSFLSFDLDQDGEPVEPLSSLPAGGGRVLAKAGIVIRNCTIPSLTVQSAAMEKPACRAREDCFKKRGCDEDNE
jgi:hypothetical protein